MPSVAVEELDLEPAGPASSTDLGVTCTLIGGVAAVLQRSLVGSRSHDDSDEAASKDHRKHHEVDTPKVHHTS